MAVITISRQYGSLGEEVAMRVCDLLGYSFFDRCMMEQLASELSQAGKPVIDLSEDNYHVRTTLERVLSGGASRSLDPCQSWIEECPGGLRVAEWVKLDEEAAIHLVQGSIRAAYQHGNVVILGRGGQAFLKDKPGVLHVRIQAPFEKRVETVVNHCMMTHPEARELLTRKDRATAEYLRRFYRVDVADPRLYHLVMDTGVIHFETAAQIVAQAAGCLAPVTAG